jgi:hypothetical protein
MFGLELTAKYLGIADKMFRWELALKCGDRAYTFPYGCGFAHCKRAKTMPSVTVREKMTVELARALRPYGEIGISDTEGYVVPIAPDLQNVLECLQSDARCGAHMLFEDFASELGYDTDSRGAEKTWRACQEARGQLQRLLGADFTAFENHDFIA